MVSALLGIALSWITILLVVKLSRAGFLAAAQNHRSNHRGAPQQVGGFGIAACTAAAIASAALFGGTGIEPALMAACLLLFATGLADDILVLPALPRLAAHLLAACLLVYAIAAAHLPAAWLWLPASIATAYWINAVNFMDGIDLMLVAGLGVPLVFAVLFLLPAQPEATAIQALALWATAGLAGFALWNVPPARVFMGDSGALLLGGISAAVILIIATAYSPPVALLPFVYFLVDTGETILRRLLAGENILRAHSQHAYQTAFRNGRSATWIAGLVALHSILLGAAAWACAAAGSLVLEMIVFAAGVLATLALTWWLRNTEPAQR